MKIRSNRCCMVLLLLLASPATAQMPVRSAEFQRVARIGSIDGSPEYVFGSVYAAALLPNGTVVVSDTRAGHLAQYDHSGRFIRRIGRRGAGPGEFQAPTWIQVRERDFVVFDAMLRRSSHFTFDGQYLEGRAGGETGLRHGHSVEERHGYFSTSMLASLRSNARAVLPQMLSRVIAARRGSTTRDTLLSVRSGSVYYFSDRGAGILPYHFGWATQVATHGDSLLAVVDAMAGEVVVYRPEPSGLRRLRHVRLGLAPRAVRNEDVRLVERRTREEVPRLLPPNAVTVPRAAAAVVGQALFDAAGNLWLRRWELTDPSSDDVYFVVPATGAAFQLRAPPGFIVTSFRGDLVAGVVRGEFDEHYVHIYRIRWR
jgi:hypothetical protein